MQNNPIRGRMGHAQGRRVEHETLIRILWLHPTHLTSEELLLDLCADGQGDDGRADHERAIRDLVEAGLLRIDGGSIVPTRAALTAEALLADLGARRPAARARPAPVDHAPGLDDAGRAWLLADAEEDLDALVDDAENRGIGERAAQEMLVVRALIGWLEGGDRPGSGAIEYLEREVGSVPRNPSLGELAQREILLAAIAELGGDEEAAPGRWREPSGDPDEVRRLLDLQGRRIRAIAEERGLTIGELAARSGGGTSTLPRGASTSAGRRPPPACARSRSGPSSATSSPPTRPETTTTTPTVRSSPTRQAAPPNKDTLRGVLVEAFARADEVLARRGGLPLPRGLTAHKLRHTFASIMFACGEDPYSVMRMLGHADPGFTLRVYTHMMARSEGERSRLKALVGGERLGAEGAPAPRPLDISAYEAPIMRALAERGCRAPRREILVAVGEALSPHHGPADLEALPSGPPRWEPRLAKARTRLVRRGWLADGRRGADWELTEARRAKARREGWLPPSARRRRSTERVAVEA